MMHYGWVHSQNVLDNHSCITAQYIEGSYREVRNDNRDEDSEQTGDETHDTITSGDRSPSADIFRLEFAATQWSKLVSNAEGLFSKIVTNNMLPHNEQDQIKQWLCMKQEYEECITSDDTASIPGFTECPRRSLEIIEEVTETDESGNRTEYRNVSEYSDEDSGDENVDITEEEDDDDDEDEDDEEEQSDASISENPDFLEKLDECMNKLKIETDKLIDSVDNEFENNKLVVTQKVNNDTSDDDDFDDCAKHVKQIPMRNQNKRRNSMLPGSEMCNDIAVFSSGLKLPQKNIDEKNNKLIDNINKKKLNNNNSNNCTMKNKYSPDILIDTLKSNEIPEEIKTLKALTINNEAKQTEVKKIQSDLNGAHKRIEELQTTIKIKEKFIADMVKNSETRSNAKMKFQHKKSKLEEEYCTTKTQLAQAKNSMHYDNENTTHKREIELYKNIAINYEKRMLDIEMIKQIADDSAKKVIELESSLNSSKKQMEKLKKQLKKEEQRKGQLEEELSIDQKKIRELEEKYNLTASKLKEMQSESEDERVYSRSKDEIDKKKEAISARILHLGYVLAEKSMNLEKTDDTDEKAALRHEIDNLRRTKQCLVDEKCNLDVKFRKELLSTVEERKRLECGETIEAIDVIIEHKNEKICGRKYFDDNQNKKENIESILMERLSVLSSDEVIKLFLKYFRKVIDLKESSKILDEQIAETESRLQTQEVINHTLRNNLKHVNLEAERKIVFMQKQHEEKLTLMFRHFADETGSSSHDIIDKGNELVQYRIENQTLKSRLAYLEELVRCQMLPGASSPPRIQQQELKKVGPPKTQVTRQKNKIIIQKTGCEKRHK